MTHRSLGMVAAAMSAGWLVAVEAQAPAAGSQDIMPALLVEVRGLRAAMEQMTSAGARIQLALGRLQLQEQRLAAAGARLVQARNDLAGAQRRSAELQEQIAGLEATLSGRDVDLPKIGPTPEMMRQVVSIQLPDSQRELGTLGNDLQRLPTRPRQPTTCRVSRRAGPT